MFSYAAVGRSYRETVVSTNGAVVSQSVNGTRCEIAAALAVDSVRDDGQPRELSLRIFRLVVRDGFLPAEEGGAVDARDEPLPNGTELKVTYPERGAGDCGRCLSVRTARCPRAKPADYAQRKAKDDCL